MAVPQVRGLDGSVREEEVTSSDSSSGNPKELHRGGGIRICPWTIGKTLRYRIRGNAFQEEARDGQQAGYRKI